MQTHRIRYLLALCKTLNFSRAAELCGVAQPTISIAVRDLEKELGGRIFHRTPAIRLTAFGKSVRPLLAEILRTNDKIHKIARAAKRRRKRR
jgi:LysR family hydrogen peroxide-inducible transcriptional activator